MKTYEVRITMSKTVNVQAENEQSAHEEALDGISLSDYDCVDVEVVGGCDIEE